MLAGLADAVHYAHNNGVIHRDIKPENIIVDVSGEAHITDFGLARRDSIDRSTSLGRVMGTPAYMSPEQARGDVDATNPRTDVYSLGVVLYEALTGERPFQGTRQLLLLQVLEDEPRALRQLVPELPLDLETICLKAMSKSPAGRYQSAQELASDLRAWLTGEPIGLDDPACPNDSGNGAGDTRWPPRSLSVSFWEPAWAPPGCRTLIPGSSIRWHWIPSANTQMSACLPTRTWSLLRRKTNRGRM